MVRWARVGPALTLVVAAAVGGGLALTDDRNPEPTVAGEPAPMSITSDAPRFEGLDQLVAASDLVVRGTVVAVEPGRVFGEPGQTAVRSRLVTLTLEEVLAGPAEAGSSVLVEEPGWLEDGTPIEVDGVAGAAVGAMAIWFLQAVEPMAAEGGSGPAAYVLTGPQGHFLVQGGGVLGATSSGGDPLTKELEGLGADGLATAVHSLVPSPSS